MNLASIIDPHADDAVALVWRGEPTTYGELRALVAGARGGLAARGVQVGDRVALLCGNTRHFVVGYLAIMGIGAVVVPLNPFDPSAALEREIAEVEAVAVVVDGNGASGWAGIDRATVPTVRLVVAAGSDIDGADTYLDELCGTEPVPVVDRIDRDLACLLFTSGTAGAPRAAMLDHGCLQANIDQAQRVPDAMTPADVVLCVLPLHHVFGLNVALGQTLTVGASIVLVQRFDPATALDTITERGVTVVPGAPPMWTAWAAFTEAPPEAFANVRLALTGAAAMPPDAARTFEERFGVPLREGYGLTEASPVVTTSVGMTPRPGSVGKVLPGVQVRVVDTEGNDALVGDPGEIWVKGANVFPGYWRDPEATARVLDATGWLHTGDVAVADEDGFLWLVDRAKDLIIVSGFNVYPAEVEEIIAEHPGVAECAVVGVAHPHTGEAVKAYVVARKGVELVEEQIVRHCADHLARYKCPTKVLIVDELPRNAAGKLLRRILR